MKRIIVIASIFAISTAFISPELPIEQVFTKNISGINYENTAVISEQEFNIMTANYTPFDSKQTKGGAFNKSDLSKIVTDMPEDMNVITMRFAIDPTSGKISLMLKGSHHSFLNDVEYRRNGGSDAAFCPLNCNMPASASNVSMTIRKSDFDNLASGFQQQYPTATLGGKLNKEALSALLNSLPTEQNVVHFRFGNDNGKVSVMFMGGSVGQQDGSKFCFRNAGDAAFCPMNCD